MNSLMRLLLAASLALTAPAKALAANLQRPAVPGNAAAPPLGLPAAGAPLPLQPSGMSVPMELPAPELSPGTVGAAPTDAAALPVSVAADKPIVDNAGHSARNVEAAAAPEPAQRDERPVLVAAQAMAEQASETAEAPAETGSAALSARWDLSLARPDAPAVPVLRRRADRGKVLFLSGVFVNSMLLTQAPVVGMPQQAVPPGGYLPLVGWAALLSGGLLASLATSLVDRLTQGPPGRRLRFDMKAMFQALLLSALILQGARMHAELIRLGHTSRSAPPVLVQEDLDVLSQTLLRKNSNYADLREFIVRNGRLEVLHTESVEAPTPGPALDALDLVAGEKPIADAEVERLIRESPAPVSARSVRMAADLQNLFLRASADPALRADPRRVHEEYLRATARYGKTWSLPGRQASARKAFAAVDARRAAWRDLTASAASWAAMAASWFWWAYGGGAAFLAGLWRRLRAGAAFLRERLRAEPEPPIDPELRRKRAEVAAGIAMTVMIPFLAASLLAFLHSGPLALAAALAALGVSFGMRYGFAYVRRPEGKRFQFAIPSLLSAALVAAFLVQGWSLSVGLRESTARPLTAARAQVERTREILSRPLVNKAADLREFTYSQYLLEGDYSNPEFHLTAELRAAMDLISESPRPWTIEELDALERRLRDSNLQDPLQTPGWIGPLTRVELDAAAALHRLYLEARADPALDPLRLHLAYLEASAPYSVKDAPVLSSLAVDLSGSMRESVSVSATLERRKAGAEAFFARKKKDAEAAFRDFARAEVRERNLRRESYAFAALAAVWLLWAHLGRRLFALRSENGK